MIINIIADVHGRFNTFSKLIKMMPTSDEVVLLGDLIDRGSRGVEMVKYAMENDVITILGNHEFLFLQNFDTQHNSLTDLSKEDRNILKNAYINEDFRFIEEINEKLGEKANDFIKDAIEYFRNLPLKVEISDLYISHTPFIKEIEKLKNSRDIKELMFNKTIVNSIPDKFNIFGHNGREMNYAKNNSENMFGSTLSGDYSYELGKAVCIDGMSNYLIGANVNTETKEIKFYAVNGNREWNKKFNNAFMRSPSQLESIVSFIETINGNKKKEIKHNISLHEKIDKKEWKKILRINKKKDHEEEKEKNLKDKEDKNIKLKEEKELKKKNLKDEKEKSLKDKEDKNLKLKEEKELKKKNLKDEKENLKDKEDKNLKPKQEKKNNLKDKEDKNLKPKQEKKNNLKDKEDKNLENKDLNDDKDKSSKDVEKKDINDKKDKSSKDVEKKDTKKESK